jgi:hypothetical protein
MFADLSAEAESNRLPFFLTALWGGAVGIILTMASTLV